MSLIDYDVAVSFWQAMLDAEDDLSEWCDVTVHGVERFDSDPDAPSPVCDCFVGIDPVEQY